MTFVIIKKPIISFALTDLFFFANKLTGSYMVKKVYYHHHHHDIRFNVCFPHKHELTQPVITCSTLTIKTLQQGVKYVQSSQ